MIEAYVNYWKGFADFGGRTNVGGYWWAFLCNIIVSTLVGVVAMIPVLGFVSYVFSIANLVPGLAILVRRLRDAGYSWCNIFWPLLPVIGTIILILKLVKPSK